MADDFDELTEEQQDQKRKAEDARRTFVEDIKWLMSSPRGRRFVLWLLGKAGVYRTSFNNSGSVMAFNEGQRNLGLMVQGEIIDICHDQFVTMLQEQRKK